VCQWSPHLWVRYPGFAILRKKEEANMQAFRAKSLSVVALAVLGFALFLAAAAPQPQPQAAPVPVPEIVLTLDPVQSTVHWTVDSTLHMVHGTFVLKSGRVHFDPETGKAGGEIVVAATSGESGSSSRDARMRKEILETPKYPDVIFRPTQIQGKVGPSGASDVKLDGVFSIHGADHNLTALVHAELTGDRWRGTGKFEVPYVKWGIKDPSNVLLKVKPVVNVELEMSGEVKTPK
jgi:polyisoprenoid-binding protein YceI